MKITRQEVQYVARLARLQLSESEAEAMTGQLDRILSYIDKLNELDTSTVVPTTHAIAMVNAFREDEPGASLPRAEALANGPLQNGEAFVVPKIL
jgi:aspartyl-tRNA(Asn)/glutamyl-tRNA(Gln) amidotransferase subunit C